ncbi:unnamed protein product [Rhodiola kirilowii]
MGSDSRPLRVFFFPFMAHGHLIPMVDIARLFSSQGVHSTIITTPLNANYISKTTSLSIKNVTVSCCGSWTSGRLRESRHASFARSLLQVLPSRQFTPSTIREPSRTRKA